MLDFHLGSRSEGLWHMLGDGIFTQDGPAWSHSREMLRRQFARMQYQNLGVFDGHVELLMSRLSAHAKKGGTVDLQPEFFSFTLATTTALIFGEPVGSVNDNDTENTFAESFDYASLISARRIRLADLYWLYTPRKFSEACNTVKRYAQHFVKQALKELQEREKRGEEGKPSHAFILDLYEELQDEEKVRDQLVHVLLAGRDTTACLMSWTM
jgi:cytochrome P450